MNRKARACRWLPLLSVLLVMSALPVRGEAPVAVEQGWRTQVERRIAFDGTRIRDGREHPVHYASRVRFIEESLRVVDGRIHATRFRILEAREGEDGNLVEVAAPGTGYVLEHLPDGNRLLDPATGRAFGNQALIRLMDANLAFDLWPRASLTPGLAWAFRGVDLARRLSALRVRDGRLNLRVAAIAPEPNTGLRTATIRGRLNARIDYDGLPADYGARVEIQLPIRLGMPFRSRFSGRLHGRDGQDGVDGDYEFVQTIAPSRAILAQLDSAPAAPLPAAAAPATDPDANRFDANGRTRLMTAALEGDGIEVGIWLRRGADPNLRDPKGRGAVFYAVAPYNHEVLGQLLEAGADPDLTAANGTFPLVLLATAKDFGGDRARDYLATVQALLEAGADPDQTYQDGMTPLMYAALNDNPGLVKALLERGAHRALTNKDGLTALDIARGFGHAEVVELLRH